MVATKSLIKFRKPKVEKDIGKGKTFYHLLPIMCRGVAPADSLARGVRDCPKRSKLSTIAQKDSDEQLRGETLRLGTMLLVALKQHKSSYTKGLMCVNIMVAGKKPNALVDTSVSDLFAFVNTAKMLGLDTMVRASHIKTVNSTEVPTLATVSNVSMQLGQRVVPMRGEETYIATLSMNESETNQVALVSSEVVRFLDEYIDVMLVKLPSYLPRKWGVDHKIELVPVHEKPKHGIGVQMVHDTQEHIRVQLRCVERQLARKLCRITS
ncbi:Uncharacterized protein TCM_019088 [Theobroma cacao]|uniref:Uncharacterized protein n=1 Tax=Theobroma cacao TaxID=3641 RepID=A0A061EGT7_THECC|nr:Uncharacterized protein TCM_019088 [Theobroma cacao]